MLLSLRSVFYAIKSAADVNYNNRKGHWRKKQRFNR